MGKGESPDDEFLQLEIQIKIQNEKITKIDNDILIQGKILY